jgi:four helix bundle protein
MAPFDRLTAFQKSYELGLAVLKSTEKWPKQHQFGIAAQARRASTSVSINIAEGSCKRGRAEFRRYLDIALGSLAETEVLLRFGSHAGGRWQGPLGALPGNGRGQREAKLKALATYPLTHLLYSTESQTSNPDSDCG